MQDRPSLEYRRASTRETISKFDIDVTLFLFSIYIIDIILYANIYILFVDFLLACELP